MRTRRLLLALFAALALLAAACGDDDSTTADTSNAAATDEADEADAEPAEDADADAAEEDAGDEPTIDGEPLSLVLLIGGPANDGGFYQAMADGLRSAAETDGAIEVTVIESIAEGGDAALEDAVRNAASSGDHDLIVAHGFDLVPGVARYAPEFPAQAFSTSLPVEGATNVNVYLSVFEELGYNAGFLAAQGVPEGGTVGFIGGPGLPFELQAEAGFRQAIEEYAPGAEIQVVYTGTFEDPQLGLETARQMFDAGVTSLWNQLAAGQSGVYQACRDAGAPAGDVFCFGNSTYSAGLAPDVVLASTVSNYEV
ncbi:MAG TPA: BMP family ABC transporter substrate-binding protein, partial [Acidimicrobiales bacterium]|nr:BMP family ABC transporter substrate-binding protein [Acidimicrobiales bacterium]